MLPPRTPGPTRRQWLALHLGAGVLGLWPAAAPALPARPLQFPRDHGSHPEFKIEWWYITGHLFTESQARYGFQATFFRSSGPRTTHDSRALSGREAFGSSDLHLAHIALSDVTQRKFLFEERLNRAGWDATADETTLAVRNGNWSLTLDTNNTDALLVNGSIRREAAFSLRLTPQKPLVIFGEDGVSRKGADPSASSYYLTFPRLEAIGTLTLNGKTLVVKGQAWMDHEISSSQLDDGQEGWDWASLQLRDGRDLMVYRLRRKGGATDPHSQLAWVDKDGTVTRFSAARFTWTTDRLWKSPNTGGSYPISVRLEAIDPSSNRPVVFHLEPLFDAQELNGPLGGIPYWEGACRVRNEQGEEIGSAYLELTGYSGNLAERFR